MKRFAILACALVAPLALATPAQAASRTIHDPVERDSPAYADITSVTVRNAPHRIVSTIQLRRALPNRTSAYVIITARRSGKQFVVGNQAFGKRHRSVFMRVDGDRPVRVKCPSLRVVVDRSSKQVRSSFRQSCLGRNAGALKVAGLTEGFGVPSDIDYTRQFTVRRG